MSARFGCCGSKPGRIVSSQNVVKSVTKDGNTLTVTYTNGDVSTYEVANTLPFLTVLNASGTQTVAIVATKP